MISHDALKINKNQASLTIVASQRKQMRSSQCQQVKNKKLQTINVGKNQTKQAESKT